MHDQRPAPPADRGETSHAPAAAVPRTAGALLVPPTSGRLALALARAVRERTAMDPTLMRAPARRRPGHSYRVVIDGEHVEVMNDVEEAEARRIIGKAMQSYGVRISSERLLTAVKSFYSRAPAAERAKLGTRHWLLYELAALERALGYYAPILGAARAGSTRSHDPQEIIAFGKGKASIDVDDETGSVDQSLGQRFKPHRTAGIFKPGEGYKESMPTVAKEVELTCAHELAHGLMEYIKTDFMAVSGYWIDNNTRSRRRGAEAPPTAYGNTRASEDMAESVGLYFVDPERLKAGSGARPGTPGNPCPVRFDFIDRKVKEWGVPAEPPPAGFGDAPEPAPAGFGDGPEPAPAGFGDGPEPAPAGAAAP